MDKERLEIFKKEIYEICVKYGIPTSIKEGESYDNSNRNKN